MANAKKPPRIAYGVAASDASGGIFSAQSAAGRSEKAAVIVRYASPEALERPGEIIHEHGAKFHGMWISPDGVCHAVSQDGAWHSNAGGAWRTERLMKKPLVAIGGTTEVLLASGNGPALFMRTGDAWTVQDIGGMGAGGTDFFSSFAVAAPDDAYAAGTGGLAHYDGKKWEALTHEAGPKTVVALSADDVYIASSSGLFRGNSRSGFQRVAERKLQHAARFEGDLYCCAYSGGVFLWTDGKLAASSTSDLAVGQLVGGEGRVLCALSGMQDALWIFDARAWTRRTPS